MTAVARRPEAAGLPTGIRVVRGDVMDAASMAAAVVGQEAVISSLGSKIDRKPTTVFSAGTTNLIAGMRMAGVRRRVCITGIGAGDSRGHGGFLYDRIIQPLLLNEIYRDKDRQEAIVRESGLEWTLVRPGTLTNGPRRGSFRELTSVEGITVGKISRADVAVSILNHLEDAGSYGQTLTLCY